MEVQNDLLSILSEQSISQLKEEFEKENTLQARMILSMIKEPGISRSALGHQLDVNESTLKKTLTLAKDSLWDFNTRQTQTPYDDIFVLRKLLFSGKVRTGQKYFTSLVKECELKQEWTRLDMLYIEGSRIAQINGDEQLVQKITAGRKQNAARIYEFTMLYSDIILEMIRLEGYVLRKPNQSEYAAYLESLYTRSLKIGHHLLIHTALHLRYLFFVRYNNDVEQVFHIVSEQKRNVEKYRHAMSDITYALALNNYVNFLSIYNRFGDPEPHARELRKVIHHGGGIAMINFYYSMLEYCLFECKLKEVNSWLAELERVEDTSKFSCYRYIIFSIKAFIEYKPSAFRQHFLSFYEDASHLSFPDLGITLRLLEIILFIAKAEHDLAMSRLDALRIYMSRTVEAGRHHDERRLISLLTKINEGNRKVHAALNELCQSHYRNVVFIASAIRERLLGMR